MILASVAKTHRAVIVQEAVRRGGVASDIASIIQEKIFYELDAPIEIVAGLNVPIPFNLELKRQVFRKRTLSMPWRTFMRQTTR
jgi:pyruvate dehydrogenase E1 component beta subunit